MKFQCQKLKTIFVTNALFSKKELQSFKENVFLEEFLSHFNTIYNFWEVFHFLKIVWTSFCKLVMN